MPKGVYDRSKMIPREVREIEKLQKAGKLPPRLPTVEDVLVQEARESLAVYIGIMHKTDDGKTAIPPKHLLDIVIPAIEDDSLGNTLIVAPPGSAKTNTMLGACAWWLGRDPAIHVGYICNTAAEAEKRSLAIRDIIELSPLYHALFPQTKANPKRGWKQDAWYLERPNLMDKNPTLIAVGVEGAILGARLHRILLDDICDEQNQLTDESRAKVHKWLGETVMTRLHPTKGRAIHITTRWHEQDAAAWCIERGWTYIRIEALNDAHESYWPEYYPAEWLACEGEHNPAGECCKKKQLGSDGFARQYMGEIMDLGNVRFKPQNWQEYERVPDDAVRGIITIDTAGWDEKNPRGDFAVISAWKTDGHNFYVLDVERGQWAFNEVEMRARNMQQTYGLPILVEDVPWAKPLIQRLQKETWGVMPWKVQGRSKFNRAEAVVPIQEAGNCFLPKNAPWKREFIREHQMFPRGSHDDMVDTTAMALGWLSRYAGRRTASSTGKPWKRDYAGVSA